MATKADNRTISPACGANPADGLEGYLRLAFGNIREAAIAEAVRRYRGMAA